MSASHGSSPYAGPSISSFSTTTLGDVSPVSPASSIASSAPATKPNNLPRTLPQVRAIPRPVLAVKPPPMGVSFLEGASTAPLSSCSFFSPCSSDEEDDDDSPQYSAFPRSARTGRTGKYQRLWASREPPSSPPGISLPNTPVTGEVHKRQPGAGGRRPSLASPTFGSPAGEPLPQQRPELWGPASAVSRAGTIPPFAPTPPLSQSGFYESAPATPATTPAPAHASPPATAAETDTDALYALLAHDAELLAAQTRLLQTHRAYPAHLAPLHEALAENEKSFLMALQEMYAATLSHLVQTPILPTDLHTQRDRLRVQAQKAHMRRAGPAEIASLHAKLRLAEEEIAAQDRARVDGMLQRRMEAELAAVEKRARAELRAVEQLRRRMRTEEWRATAKPEAEPEEDEGEEEAAARRPSLPPPATASAPPEKEYTPVAVGEDQEPLPPLPAPTPDEEFFLAAVDAAPAPPRITTTPATPAPRLSLTINASMATANKRPQRPLFSPTLPPEFMALPLLITHLPAPSRGRQSALGCSPLSMNALADFPRSPIPAAREEARENGAEEPSNADPPSPADAGVGSPVLCTRVNGVPITLI